MKTIEYDNITELTEAVENSTEKNIVVLMPVGANDMQTAFIATALTDRVKTIKSVFPWYDNDRRGFILYL